MTRASDWTGWACAPITIRGFDERDDDGRPEVAAGWCKGNLGLDYRPFHWSMWDTLPDEASPWLWVVTHLPTGGGMLAYSGTADEARALADRLAGLTDWASVTVESSQFLRSRVLALAAEYPGRIFNPSQASGPWAERAAP